ncbi:MAG: hypothetical protein CMJ29_09015 [Phycisphaerae bacterium]|nr:hypothetical protein [Phycisphaerae bacterium]|tara:strand:+ start:239 stop:754 length:516 start_codon:yes stop_codon:yes gene_type:complete
MNHDFGNRQGNTNRRRMGVFLAVATATLQVVAALGLMVIMGSPKGVVADDLSLIEPGQEEQLLELPFLTERLQNNRTGVTRVYDVEVVLKVSSSQVGRVHAELARQGHEFRAAVSHLWRSAEPAHLDEPYLETITRRIQDQMLEFLGRESMTGRPVVREVIVISGTGFPAE